MRRAVLALLALGCAQDHKLTADGGADYVIGGIRLRISSGTTRPTGGALGIYLTDQPDACLAITQASTGNSAVLQVKVMAQADGTTAAVVAPNLVTPGPGQAVGDLTSLEGPVPSARVALADGDVVWHVSSDGTTTIDRLDLGFMGTADRLLLGGMTVPACP